MQLRLNCTQILLFVVQELDLVKHFSCNCAYLKCYDVVKELIFRRFYSKLKWKSRKTVATDMVFQSESLHTQIAENKFNINPQRKRKREIERTALHYIIQGHLKRKQKESLF